EVDGLRLLRPIEHQLAVDVEAILVEAVAKGGEAVRAGGRRDEGAGPARARLLARARRPGVGFVPGKVDVLVDADERRRASQRRIVEVFALEAGLAVLGRGDELAAVEDLGQRRDAVV